MNASLLLLCLGVILHCAYAPPVSPDKQEDSPVKDDLEEYMEYHRYLKEVVQALESDPDFRERLEKADEDDVRSGKIAEQLDFVNHNVRSKLDEIKRRELDRLRHLATKQFELTNELNHSGKVPTNEHLDHNNPHTFEIEDLKKLIQKTTKDLEEADKKRKEEFKEYEMQKEFEKHQKLEEMDEAQKKEFEEKQRKEEEAKKHHQPLHHPGSKPQLEEVWEKQDHMDQQFDPRAFFMLHDVDGNGVWDADEVKALFIKELDKLYGPAGPNKDLHERAEEMERMREHVFKENDKNRDGLIDFQEFMAETQRSEFQKDEGWKPIDENEVYSQQEYQAYEQQRLAEIRYLQQLGLVDAHGRPLPGAHSQISHAHQIFQQYYQQYHQAPPLHPNQYQPQYQGHPSQFQQPQGTFQQPQGQFQQPQGQFQQPQGQFQQPQGQYPPQVQYQQPQGQFQQSQGQYPPQGYQQAPQGQYQAPQGQPQGQLRGQPIGHVQGQPQGQPMGQAQGQPIGQAQGEAQGQPIGQAQGQPMGQAQGQPIGQAQGQPAHAQGQPAQAQGQPAQAQGQPGQAQGQGQPQPPVLKQTEGIAQNQAQAQSQPQAYQNQGQASQNAQQTSQH